MNPTYFIFFIAILIGTVVISYWSAKRGNSTHLFYSAGQSLTGVQNGLAIAGDYMSAASFLGITGAIAIYGFDGFLYSIGFLVSYLLLLFIAEPIRHLGRFTLGDVIYARFPSDSLRFVISLNTIIISVLYMVPQLVAAGLLIHLLLGIDFSMAVLVTGILMTMYVVFGGMVSTSWVQIIKTVMLISGTLLISLVVLSRFDWNVLNLFDRVKQVTPYGEQFFSPGNLFSNPLDTLSLNLSLILGTAGLPHILNRFFTVKDSHSVRISVVTATWVIGIFYLITLILGFGAVAFVGWNQLVSVDPTGNMTAPLLASALGGEFFMAFISAVAFSTILAVVTGLLLTAASSFSHDVYNHLLRNGKASEKSQLQMAKIAAAVIGLISILIAVTMKNTNVALPVSLTFVVAASTNLPLILFTLYWKRFNTTGAATGIITGMAASLTFVLFGPHMNRIFDGGMEVDSVLHLNYPGIIVIPLGFVGAILGTLCSRKPVDEENFLRVFLQSQTGIKPNEVQVSGQWEN
ncbi:solute symporter family protein [Effusibacillus lacus]|uniref:Cation acetate symporter n=1 Tax=Effusibacillus lacus TaxID=1348429 RepID=A0A292YJU1_9BACL|nr:cation acetate symporter [Effusibacillus lacus]TCS69402.1 cation/acetate symporter [Effusibacillus lacus]GAX89169.1 cation acetate symporter [Effusibacillus lacus]